MSIRSFDTGFWNIDVLRSRAHLSRIQGERKRNILDHPLEVRSGVDDDLIDARLLGEDQSLPRFSLQPFAVLGAPGKIDELHLGTLGQGLSNSVIGP